MKNNNVPIFSHRFLLANREWLIVYLLSILSRRENGLSVLSCALLSSVSLEFDVLPEQLHQLPLTPSPVPGHLQYQGRANKPWLLKEHSTFFGNRLIFQVPKS